METYSGLVTWVTCFENDNDALVPEVWAQEGLMILESNLTMGQLVHRDFEEEIAEYGDVVNAHRPSTFTAKRKTDSDDVTDQDATATKVPVTLNQWLHVSFVIKDGELSKGFVNLLNYYLRPAIIAHAEGIDRMLTGQVYRFLTNAVGKLGTDLTKSTIIATREKCNDLRMPQMGRNMVVTSDSEGALLEIGDFTKANEIGDAGYAIREASLGRKLGFNFFMDQNTPHIASGNTVVTGAVNNSSGYAVGDTAITVDGFSAAITAGAWCTIGGDMTPQKITGTTGGSTPTALAIAPGLRYAVANDAVVTVYTPGAINLSAGYAANHGKAMVIDGFSVAPKLSQLISIGALSTDPVYCAFETPTTTSLTLERPLYAAVLNDAAVCPGPAGNYNFAFHKNALALVTRPLAMPIAGTGALAYTAVYGGLALRVVITYDGKAQGHRVTVDHLCGVEVLDVNLGVPVLG